MQRAMAFETCIPFGDTELAMSEHGAERADKAYERLRELAMPYIDWSDLDLESASKKKKMTPEQAQDRWEELYGDINSPEMQAELDHYRRWLEENPVNEKAGYIPSKIS